MLKFWNFNGLQLRVISGGFRSGNSRRKLSDIVTIELYFVMIYHELKHFPFVRL